MKEKILVKNFWNKASCGEELYLQGDSDKDAFISQSKKRYELEPYIVNFADFSSTKNKKVLEIGSNDNTLLKIFSLVVTCKFSQYISEGAGAYYIFNFDQWYISSLFFTSKTTSFYY